MSKNNDEGNTQNTAGDENNKSDRHFEQLMRGVGKRPEIPTGVQDNAEQHFRKELASVNASRVRRKRLAQYALAATVIISSVILLNLFREPTQAPIVIGVISESVGNGYWQNNGTERSLAVGNQLSVGDVFSTSDGYARLSLYNNTIDFRVGQNSKFSFASADSIHLQRGSIYIDATENTTARFLVNTRYGTVEHIGTQYMVTSNQNEVTIAVREGEIRYQGGSGVITSHATENKAELISITRTGLHSRRAIPTSGEQWYWVNNVSPEFSTAGKSFMVILNWTARETGRKITFTSDEIRLQAEMETKPFEGNIPFKPWDRNLNQFIRDTVGLSGGFVISDLDSANITIGWKQPEPHTR